MNLTLRNVIQTSPDGDRFFKLDECYVRGNNIKYLRIPDEVIDKAKEAQANQRASNKQQQQSSRGGNSGQRGRGGTRGGSRGGPSRGRGRGRGM